jgi:hypothetical protein
LIHNFLGLSVVNKLQGVAEQVGFKRFIVPSVVADFVTQSFIDLDFKIILLFIIL